MRISQLIDALQFQLLAVGDVEVLGTWEGQVTHVEDASLSVWRHSPETVAALVIDVEEGQVWNRRGHHPSG